MSGFSTLNNATITSNLNVLGFTTINGTLTVSGNTTFKSCIYCNENDNKVFSFDGSGYGRLGFLKQSGTIPKICAGTGTSIISSHLLTGDLTQTISSTGIIVLDRMTINTYGNVGIGTKNPSNMLHVIGNTLLGNDTTINGILNVSGFTTLANNTTVYGTFNISGFTKLVNNTTIVSSLDVSGLTTFANKTTIYGTLNVSGYTTLNNITTILSSLNISGFAALNNTTITSSLNVSGITTILKTMHFPILFYCFGNIFLQSHAILTFVYAIDRFR